MNKSLSALAEAADFKQAQHWELGAPVTSRRVLECSSDAYEPAF